MRVRGAHKSIDCVLRGDVAIVVLDAGFDGSRSNVFCSWEQDGANAAGRMLVDVPAQPMTASVVIALDDLSATCVMPANVDNDIYVVISIQVQDSCGEWRTIAGAEFNSGV